MDDKDRKDKVEFDASYFRYCRRLDGALEPVDTVRRNGRLVPRFHPSLTEPEPLDPQPPEIWEKKKFFINLSPVERQTWRKLLRGQPITAIAEQEGITRAAVYERIRGNSKQQGGMIAKNFWVLLWWRLRQRLQYEELH